jgi:hypothetical protein
MLPGGDPVAWLSQPAIGPWSGAIAELAAQRQLALDSPYQRKDPQSAAGYFRSVGLRGPFWGLSD